MATLLPNIFPQYFDNDGDPLAGGKIYTYTAGTSTPKETYTDEDAGTPNANPVILDSAGRATIYIGAGAYKFILKDSDDNTIATIDDIEAVEDVSVDGAWTEHSVTDGQSATNLSGETVVGTTHSSAVYEYEIIRGTTVVANGRFSLQYRNSTWRLQDGGYEGDLHGVTFSVSQTSATAQLRAALDSGAGNGTIKLSRRRVAA